MWQWITFIIIFVSVITFGVTLLSGNIKVPLVEPVIERVEEIKDQVLGVKDTVDSVDSQKVIQQTKEESKVKVDNTAVTINSIIDNVLGQKVEESMEVVLEDKRDFGSKLYEVDLLTDRDLRLSFKKGERYQIKFSNIPEGFCIFFSNQKYELDSNKYLSLVFISSGKFPIKMDYCEPSGKNLGELEVN